MPPRAGGGRGPGRLPEAPRLGEPPSGEGRIPLEQTRQLEAELESQLRRIEREAAAAREYRDIEARYRELSLAHLYRIATRDLDGLERRLEEARSAAPQSWPRASVTCARKRKGSDAARPTGGRAGKTERDWRAWRMAPKTCGARPCARTGTSCAWRRAGARGRDGGSPSPVSKTSSPGSRALWLSLEGRAEDLEAEHETGARRRTGAEGPSTQARRAERSADREQRSRLAAGAGGPSRAPRPAGPQE